MKEAWKYTVWPWIRDKAGLFLENLLFGWFYSVSDNPFAHVASMILGAILLVVFGMAL